MRWSIKQTVYATAVLGLAGGPGTAAATDVHPPFCAAQATCGSGSLSFSDGTCGQQAMRGMMVGTFFWNVVTGYSSCASTPQTPANYVYANGANGYRFYQYHHNHSVNSYSRTCDRCSLGLVGATGHTYGAGVEAVASKYGTVQTDWYSAYLPSCGSGTSVACGQVVGRLDF